MTDAIPIIIMEAEIGHGGCMPLYRSATALADINMIPAKAAMFKTWSIGPSTSRWEPNMLLKRLRTFESRKIAATNMMARAAHSFQSSNTAYPLPTRNQPSLLRPVYTMVEVSASLQATMAELKNYCVRIDAKRARISSRKEAFAARFSACASSSAWSSSAKRASSSS
jgi:hypothetical protein